MWKFLTYAWLAAVVIGLIIIIAGAGAIGGHFWGYTGAVLGASLLILLFSVG